MTLHGAWTASQCWPDYKTPAIASDAEVLDAMQCPDVLGAAAYGRRIPVPIQDQCH